MNNVQRAWCHSRVGEVVCELDLEAGAERNQSASWAGGANVRDGDFGSIGDDFCGGQYVCDGLEVCAR